jgi:hypothetical protein
LIPGLECRPRKLSLATKGAASIVTNYEAEIATLRERLAKQQVIVFIGAGVTAGATGAKISTWNGLLENGIDYVSRAAPHYSSAAIKQLLKNASTADDFIEVADELTHALGGTDDVKFREWLKNIFETLTPTEDGRKLLAAILNLDNSVITTNYDHLLEIASDSSAYDLTQLDDVVEVINKNQDGIIHLHGHYKVPRNIVLDTASYRKLVGSQEFLRLRDSLSTFWYFLLIGYGSGTADPNFKRWRDSLETTSSGLLRPMYRLCLKSEIKSLAREHRRDRNVFLIPYGEKHEQLVPFLEELAPIAASTAGVEVKILKPSQTVLREHAVHMSGSVVGLRSGIDLWIVKQESRNNFHPDAPPVYVRGNEWFGTAYLGPREGQLLQPTRHTVHIVAARKHTSATYKDYIEHCHKTNRWPGLPSLFGGESLDYRELTRVG